MEKKTGKRLPYGNTNFKNSVTVTVANHTKPNFSK
jgi:hypothetical protein